MKTIYLSVQKIYGKSKAYGEPKGVVTYEENKGTAILYKWRYTEERFEHKNLSYKFVVKHSYRQDGKVKQKQMVLGTHFWLDFIESRMTIELNDEKISQIFEASKTEIEKLRLAIEKKIDEIEGAVFSEYCNSNEYKTWSRYAAKVARWEDAKKVFQRKFPILYHAGLLNDCFEQIYDFNLQLRNSNLLNILEQKEVECQREFDRRRQKEREDFKKHYGSYFTNSFGDYTSEEKSYLHKFYRTLAKNFHPDICRDDGKAMQFLNKLKEQWGV